MKKTSHQHSRLWWVLLAGPLLFLAGIVVMSAYYGFALQGQNIETIPDLVAGSTPYQLVAIQIILLLIVLRAMRREGLTFKTIGWQPGENQHTLQEALLGGGAGIVLGLLYIFVLSPLLTSLQQVWDYIPPGELLTSLGAALIPFVIADVLLAPFVEEILYRGYAWTLLAEKFSKPVTVLLSCALFGLLHWTGGFWYILLVGFVAGGLFAWLRLSRRNLIAPFAAHLALNVVETVYILITMTA